MFEVCTRSKSIPLTALLSKSRYVDAVSSLPVNLFRYLDEQAFRYNNRKDMNDGDRFVKRFDAHVCAVDTALQQAPEVFQPVGCVFRGKVNAIPGSR